MTRRLALVFALLAIAVGLAVVALLGPLVGGPIEYHVSETLRNQTVGLDAVSLLVVVPLAVTAAELTRRRHSGGPVVALGVGAYTSYMFVQYIVGPEYLSRPGDNQRLFPLFVALFALGWISALLAWQAVEPQRLASSRRRERALARVVLPLLGFLAFSRYVPALADAMRGRPHDAGYRAGPAFFWVIAMLDLGVFLPGTIATCVGLLQGRAWALKAMYLVVGWFALVGPAVAAMAISMYVNDDPTASAANAVFMTLMGLAFVALAVAVYRPLFGVRHAGRRRHPGGTSP